MKNILRCAILTLCPLAAHAAQPWQEVTVPTVAQAAATFANPPKEYGAIHWAIWGGVQNKERIIADIDRIAANGGGVYMINNSQRVAPKYLSPEYMDLVKTVVQQCKKNGMKVWIETDCGYPDGFAGGLISKDYPQLGMQGIIPDAHCTIAAGAALDIPLPVDTLGILASPAAAAPADAAGTIIPLPADGTYKYTPARRGNATLTVQLPGADIRYTLSPGEPFAIPVPPGTKGLVLTPGNTGGGGGGGRGARGGAGNTTVISIPADGRLKWTAPTGTGAWDLTFVRHIYRSSPTRNDNGDDGGATKDGYYSLIDYLDPQATATFMKLIHETYAQAVGEEFGKTVLGFRGDEPDYTGFIPWTPKLLETFKALKGYDLTPYIAQFFGAGNADSQRARADYYDVWSGMFRDNFYKPQQDWCRARGMDYMVHINHEEAMMSLVASEGSFWRNMRYVGVPGIDNINNQISVGNAQDYPKLAASAAHLFGRAQVWEENGGSVGVAGKFIFDCQLVRGVNYMNIRGMTAANTPAAPDPTYGTGWYYSRAQHLMAIGRPAAQVALYHPTASYWLNDREADTANLKLVTQLLEQQIDFDHIDEDAITSTCTLEKDGLKNLSGQTYRAVIIPPCTALPKNMLERLRAFADTGGKVICIGRTPTTLVDKSFLHPEPGAPDLSFATLEPAEALTPKVLAALPAPDVKLDTPCPAIKYTRRSLQDGEVYCFFNESAQPQSGTVTLQGTGQVQLWNASTGKITPAPDTPPARGTVKIPVALAPQELRFIVIGPTPPAQP